MAPELLNPEKFGKTNSRPTLPAHMYAFGMVIYEVLTGFDPFYDQKFGTIQLVCRVLDGARPTKPGNPGEIGFGNGTWELVNKCWKTKSARRPTIEPVLTHLGRVSGSSIVPVDALRSSISQVCFSSHFPTRDKPHDAQGRPFRLVTAATRGPGPQIFRPGNISPPLQLAIVPTHPRISRPYSSPPPAQQQYTTAWSSRSADHHLAVETSGLAGPEISRLRRAPQDTC